MLLLSGLRDGNSDRCTDMKFTFDMPLRMMKAQDLITKRHTKPGSTLFAGAGFIYHIKRFGDFVDFICRNSFAGILYADAVIVIVGITKHSDRIARRGSLSGVVDQINEQR